MNSMLYPFTFVSVKKELVSGYLEPQRNAIEQYLLEDICFFTSAPVERLDNIVMHYGKCTKKTSAHISELNCITYRE